MFGQRPGGFLEIVLRVGKRLDQQGIELSSGTVDDAMDGLQMAQALFRVAGGGELLVPTLTPLKKILFIINALNVAH